MVAQLRPIDLVAPGFRGVNFEQSQALIEPRFATRAENAVIDGSGRLSSRKGWSSQTSTAITGSAPVKTLFEQIGEDGTRTLITAWDGGIGDDIDDPEGNDISGSVTDSNGHWNFQNFANKVIGFQDGQKPIVRTSGNFATVVESAGTAPTIADGVGLCAYGRVYGLDSDKQTIKYSVLLDETDWNSAGAGSIDMSNIWTLGTDQVRAIVAFNGFLLVFGHRHIVVFEDTTQTALGFDPGNMVVRDVYENVGTISWTTIQKLGKSDLIFVSHNGVQTLGRIVQEKSANLTTLTQYVDSQFMGDINDNTSYTEVSSGVDTTRGYYIVSFHQAVLRTWVFHYKRAFRDEDTQTVLFPITTWTLTSHAWLWDTANARMLLGYDGGVGQYGTIDTDNGTSFSLEYESPWFEVAEQFANNIKILKRLGSILFVQSATTVTFKWDFDFGSQFRTKAITFSAGAQSEWGEAEWGLGEWSGGARLRIRKFPAYGQGQYIRIGLSVAVQSEISIQQLEVFAKIGRLA